MNVVTKSVEIGQRTLTLEVGRFAPKATAAVLARYGDTMVLSTVVASSQESKLNYFPLSVEYIERLYAGGRIKGSRWVKREGRPSDDSVLKGRIIDRSIRPLFDKRFHHDIQVIVTILSVDGENEPDTLGLIATSAALSISPIPWNGPIGAVHVGYVGKGNGESGLFVNPRTKDTEFSEMDLVVAATDKKVVMLEGAINELPEDIVFKGIQFAKAEIKNVITCINDLQKAVGAKKILLTSVPAKKELIETIKKQFDKDIAVCIEKASADEQSKELTTLKEAIQNHVGESVKKEDVDEAVETILKEKIRKTTLSKKKRIDGRDPDTIRPIAIEVGILPRTHGSAMFQRGETQVLTVATLGSPSLEQLIESAEGESAKRFMHHYSMPPYSVGETGRVGFLSRREIGHGALAEKALIPVIPSQEAFPYTIRLVSEVMSSNGSTSMASTCGSTLALMDSGVPIKYPIAGLSIGLIQEDDTYVLLKDIVGFEDFYGDMDFKVAGSTNGITAIQLDMKIDGLTDEIIQESLQKAKEGRAYILEKMLAILETPRTTLSQYAPRVALIAVPKDKIGEVIGPGGRMIRQIIAETTCDINVNDEGKVTITGMDAENVEIARKWIEGIIKEVKPEEVYRGIVKRILPFGAFVEILPGREGMVHVSQMSASFVSDPTAVVSIGQQVTVRVIEVDEQGRINLSMLFGEDQKKKETQQNTRHPRPHSGKRPFTPRRRY